jgi:hypothetical protein
MPQPSSKPKYRPHKPSSAGTLLDERVPTTVGSEPEDDSVLARSTADRLQARTSRREREHSNRECYYHDCDVVFDPAGEADDLPEGYNNQYHSYECWSRQVAARLIRGVRLDHIYCASCFAELKEIERPPDGLDVPDCVVGYQYFDPEATERGTGEIIVPNGSDSTATATRQSGHAPDSDGVGLSQKGEIRRTHCGQGPTHHATVWTPDRITLDDFINTYTPNLLAALADQRERGRHDYDLSADMLYDQVRDLKTDPEMQRRHYAVLERALAAAIRRPHYTSD